MHKEDWNHVHFKELCIGNIFFLFEHYGKLLKIIHFININV